MRCGCKEQFGDGSPLMGLPANQFVYVVESAPPGHSLDDVADWIEESTLRWRDAGVNIACRRIVRLNDASDSDIVLRVFAKALEEGVIADQELPSRNKRIYQQRWNTRQKFVPTDRAMRSGTVDPYRSGTHELGHFLGLHHFPLGDPDELMEPTISDIIRPQPTEIKMAKSLVGAVPVGPLPDDDKDETLRTLTITFTGEIVRADLPGMRTVKFNR